MPTYYSQSKGQILRIVFYCPACRAVKAFVASISHWLMHVKTKKDCTLWGSLQTRWLGRGKASGALLAQEVEEGKLISPYGRLFLDPWLLSWILVRTVLFHLDYNNSSALRTPPRTSFVLIRLLQLTVPSLQIRAISHQAARGCYQLLVTAKETIWLLVSNG